MTFREIRWIALLIAVISACGLYYRWYEIRWQDRALVGAAVLFIIYKVFKDLFDEDEEKRKERHDLSKR